MAAGDASGDGYADLAVGVPTEKIGTADPRTGDRPAGTEARPTPPMETGPPSRTGTVRPPVRRPGRPFPSARAGTSSSRWPRAPAQRPGPPPYGIDRRRWGPWRPLPRDVRARHPAREPARHRDHLARLG
ncbi:FG-GAP repeat protein [Streptomyces bacillaris]|uniref:FG-GAP repeat protein n=1 Tax=Streptomyces bacillaris TaxID=68179 RepID=UPI00382B24F7